MDPENLLYFKINSIGSRASEFGSGDYGDKLHTKSDNPTQKTHQRSPWSQNIEPYQSSSNNYPHTKPEKATKAPSNSSSHTPKTLQYPNETT